MIGSECKENRILGVGGIRIPGVSGQQLGQSSVRISNVQST